MHLPSHARRNMLRAVVGLTLIGGMLPHASAADAPAQAGNLLKKIKLEIAVNEEFVHAALAAIAGGARTGNVGDGKIFVISMADCIRIRTGERGEKVL